MKKVSIVTISFNDCNGLNKTIESVISQDFDDYEYIVIDGGSKDNTLEVIKHYEYRIDYWVSEPDKGIYNAMNKGLRVCTGEWVIFLNSGDVFASNNVLSSIDFDIKDTNVAALYGPYKCYTRYNEIVQKNAEHPFYTSKKQLRGMGFSHQSVFARRDVAQKLGFDESFKLCADYNMMMQIYKKGYKFQRVDTVIALCDGRGGASYNNRKIQDYERARVCGCEKKMSFLMRYHLTNIARPAYRWLMSVLKSK